MAWIILRFRYNPCKFCDNSLTVSDYFANHQTALPDERRVLITMDTSEHTQHRQSPLIVRDQQLITACALDIIRTVEQQRGQPLQPRDRMALKLLTPKNSALLVKNQHRHLGCKQVSFEILTDDIGLGAYRLTPKGVHVLNQESGWWSDQYGIGRFLWNLYLKEDPDQGMQRVLENLFKMETAGFLGNLKTQIHVKPKEHTIRGNLRPDLNLYIRRHEGTVETTLRRLHKAKALFKAKELGLESNGPGGRLVLLFGKNKRYAISFAVERF